MRIGAHGIRELLAAGAVLLALVALAAFSLWGMRPSTTTTSAAPAGNTPTAPAGEHEGGGD